MKFKLVAWLLLAFFFKELVWLAVIPMWHFPDEEQHFGQLAFWAEKGKFPQAREKDINKEIDESSVILGTKRDAMGVNKFTYHPEYRMAFGSDFLGPEENKIIALNTRENRSAMTKQEAARYGPIYYYLAAIPYKLFYQDSLIARVFSSRFISILLSLLTIWLVYLIGKLIFNEEFLSIILAFLVAFQPMFSFISAGINSDNLFNLLMTLLFYSCLKAFFDNKINFKYLVLLGISLILGFYTKKQIFIGLPIVVFGYILAVILKPKHQRKPYFLIIILLLILFTIIFRNKFAIPEYSPWETPKLKETFVQYTFWHLRHTVAETIPWYWGVFNWLGVTLPRLVLQIQARLLVLASIGLVVYLIKQWQSHHFANPKNIKIIFLIGAAIIYFLAIIFWDYFFRTSAGFSFGIQGRYFFPAISGHMLVILLGLISILPREFKLLGLKILAGWWWIFHFIGFYTAIKAYYQIWPLTVFINQVSQYKPFLFKGFGQIILLVLALIFSVILMVKLLNTHERNIN